ncbi:hypothetical protein LCIT_01220 [Leuconostoc citreum]|uniref:Uncharacterized protein n=1 Tax=Leuconostoc citreum TaxID=33964 RepID=A0A5A5TWL4_LEUCI|nr:hypothetical protein [Leuconostoc citreum]GDZ82880.1 hypothetical protein LCIT_01220 [Leuconostoc citreum]
MNNNDSQALEKRVAYIQEHLELLDKAIATMPILVANANNAETEQQWLSAIARFKTDLRKTYVDLSLFQNIK